MKDPTLNIIFLLICVLAQLGCINFAQGKAVSPPSKQLAISEPDVPAQNRSTQMSLTPVEPKIGLNEPILLRLSVKNDTAETIKLDLGQDFKAAFDFSIVFPDGTQTRLPRLQRDGFSAKGLVEIKTDEVYVQDILLNEWITPKQVGKYILTGAINSTLTSLDSSAQVEPQFSLTLTIEPENADRLQQISQKLLKRISESNSYADAAYSARALTHVRSPVVIPYLQKAVTANRMVDAVIVKSLRQVGSAEAVEVLINIAETMPNSELSLQAVNALKSIELQTSDPKQKRRIRQYLGH